MKKTDQYFYTFNKVFEMSDDGFIIVDSQGIITDINEKYCLFLDIKKEEALGKSILTFIPNSQMLNIMQNKYTDEGVIHTYISGKAKGEKVIVSRSYVENNMGEVIAGVAQVKFKLTSLDVTKKLIDEYYTLHYYKEQYQALQDHYGFNSLVGQHPDFISQKQRGLKVSNTDFSVLLTGETGTGKEVFAHALHNSSHRSSKPMVSINCAAIPNELLESELFGYEEGAFTGAKKGGKKGKFLLANQSTIFLDEVGDMPLNMQAKLLRVLAEKVVEPIGATKAIPIDIRVISATKKNLQEMVINGEFREDLFYRLNVVNIEMIPLRKRQEDILLLASYFLNKLNEEYRKNITFSTEVQLSLYSYYWPGNIRELDNVIKSAYAVCNQNSICLQDLPKKIVENTERNDNFEFRSLDFHQQMDLYEESLIKHYLKINDYNVQLASKNSRIHRSLFYKKLKKYNIKSKFIKD